jgi:hypothetical protein
MAFLGVAAAWLFALVSVGAVEMIHAERVEDLQQEMESIVAENQRQQDRLRTQSEVLARGFQSSVSPVAMVAVRTPEPPKEPPDGIALRDDPSGKQWVWVQNLEVPEEGYVYRVWINGGSGEYHAVAEFTVNEDGEALVPMRLAHEYDSPMWITVHLEPAAQQGPSPSGTRVLWGRLK